MTCVLQVSSYTPILSFSVGVPDFTFIDFSLACNRWRVLVFDCKRSEET